MALSDIVTVTISTESAQVERAGFGVPLILAADAPVGFTERVRFYNSLGDVEDDFASSTATYKMASAVLAQSPRPPTIAVGRLANKPTQRWALTPTASNSTTYELEVNGVLVEYTSDGSATVAEIIAGLKAAIDALSLPITTSDQTTYLRVVADDPGNFFALESLDTSRLKIAQDHADPGVAADLAAIALEDNSWYAVLNAFNSKAMASAIATWAEAAEKLFVCQSQDSDIVNLGTGFDFPGAGANETLASALMSSFRSALIYHPRTDAFADAAWAGKVLPLDPGSETWAFKTLAGVEAASLTATQRTNLVNKRANFYESNAGVGGTQQGKVGGNEWIDVIRFRDWLKARMAEEIFGALSRADKIPFTDGGISVIEGIVRAQLKAGVEVGGLSSSPAPEVTVPLASAVSSVDKAARRLTNVKFDAVLAGAIQTVNLSGVIAV